MRAIIAKILCIGDRTIQVLVNLSIDPQQLDMYSNFIHEFTPNFFSSIHQYTIKKISPRTRD